MTDDPETSLRAAMAAWDTAMIGNDADEIGRWMADEWVIVGQDGSVTGKVAFLALVASGDVSHDEMATIDPDIRLYGDTAVVVARGISGGAYQGQKFRMIERSSCVFVMRDGRWLCVLTHLSTLADS